MEDNKEDLKPFPAIHICARQDIPNHAHLPVTHIISIGNNEDCPNIEPFREKDFVFYRFSFDDVSHDTPNGPSLKLMERMIEIFKSIWYDNENPDVLFHCAAGISRSPAAAFIYLVITGQPYQEAYYNGVYKVRGFTQPNLLMIKYADQILGKNGKMLEFVKIASGRPDGLLKHFVKLKK